MSVKDDAAVLSAKLAAAKSEELDSCRLRHQTLLTKKLSAGLSTPEEGSHLRRMSSMLHAVEETEYWLIPEEVLTQILYRHVRAPRVLYICGPVCRRWARMIRDNPLYLSVSTVHLPGFDRGEDSDEDRWYEPAGALPSPDPSTANASDGSEHASFCSVAEEEEEKEEAEEEEETPIVQQQDGVAAQRRRVPANNHVEGIAGHCGALWDIKGAM